MQIRQRGELPLFCLERKEIFKTKSFVVIQLINKIQTECPDAPVSLPAPISSIRIQVKKNDRCSLFVNNEFLIGLDQHVLLEYGFKKGDLISEEQWQDLWEKEQAQKVFHWLLNRLELRAHSTLELKQKAQQKGFPLKWIDPASEKISRLGLLDDEAFAKMYARDKQKLKNWGWIKISFELRKKGISDNLIKQVGSELQSDFDAVAEIEKLLKKREKHFLRESDLQKRKRKMLSYLVGKGFSISDCMKVISKK